MTAHPLFIAPFNKLIVSYHFFELMNMRDMRLLQKGHVNDSDNRVKSITFLYVYTMSIRLSSFSPIKLVHFHKYSVHNYCMTCILKKLVWHWIPYQFP